MQPLTIIANITIISPIYLETVKKELLKLIDSSNQDNGCIYYQLHQDNYNPLHFKFIEQWESRELWQEHMHKDHLKEYSKNTQGMISEFVLNEMTFLK